MSKKVTKPIDLEKKLMAKITAGELVMKPRWYFIAGSVVMLLSLIGLSITAIFLLNICLFLALPHGPMGELRLQLMLSNFLWWIPVVAVLGVGAAIWLLRQYDFSYKNNFGGISLLFVATIVVAAWLINVTGLNDTWFRRGPMHRFYQQLDEQNNYHMGRGMMRRWDE